MPPAPAQSIDTATVIAIVIGMSFCSTAIIVWGLSYVTGWRTLAQQFPATPPLPSATSAFGSVGFKLMGNYNNCVHFKMDEEHLHISLIPPFSWSHPGMSIPWTVVEFTGGRPTWGMTPIRIAGIRARVPKRVIARELELRQQLETLDTPPNPDAQIAARSS